MPCSTRRDRPRCCSRSSTRTCCSSRSTNDTSGTGTTDCSASCWAPSSRAASPVRPTALHLRAADWAEANGQPEMALAHAQAGRDADRATALILTLAQPTWASGRIDTVLRWMEWVEAEQLVDRYPAVAVHGALIYALLGHAIDAERWAIAADRTVSTEVLADGSTMESYVAYMRALLGREGVEAMARDARVAWDGLNPASPYRPTMQHTEAICALAAGRARTRGSDPGRGVRRGDGGPRGSVRGDDPRRAVRHRDGSERLEGRRAALGPRACDGARGPRSTTTGRARSCTRSRRASKSIAATPPERARTRRARPGSGRCSRTRCPSCRPRR